MTLGIRSTIGVDPGTNNLITWVLLNDKGGIALEKQYPAGEEIIRLRGWFQGEKMIRRPEMEAAKDGIRFRYHEIAQEIVRFAARHNAQVAIDWGSEFLSTMPSLGESLTPEGRANQRFRDRPGHSSIYRYLPVQFFIDDLTSLLRRSGLPDPIVTVGSSNTCPVCLKQDMARRDGRSFWCRRCRIELDSDVNGAAWMGLVALTTVVKRGELVRVLRERAPLPGALSPDLRGPVPPR